MGPAEHHRRDHSAVRKTTYILLVLSVVDLRRLRSFFARRVYKSKPILIGVSAKLI